MPAKRTTVTPEQQIENDENEITTLQKTMQLIDHAFKLEEIYFQASKDMPEDVVGSLIALNANALLAVRKEIYELLLAEHTLLTKMMASD